MRKGTRHTEATKEKIATAKLGKAFTPEHSAAISVALKGQKKTISHKRAISEGIKLAKSRKIVENRDLEVLMRTEIDILKEQGLH